MELHDGSGVGSIKENPVKILQYGCLICKDRFKYESGLRSHLPIHTDEKPFQCIKCNVRFKRNGDLNKHLKVHIDEKPFPCTICQKKI